MLDSDVAKVEELMPFAQSEMRKTMKGRLPNWVEAAYYVAAASNSPIIGSDIGPSVRNEIFHRLIAEFRQEREAARSELVVSAATFTRPEEV